MRIFVLRMKKEIIVVSYWLAAIFMTAFLLRSLDYDFWQAILMSLSFLPAAMALSFFLPKVERDKKRVWATIYIILGVMLMTFLLIYLWQWIFISVIGQEKWTGWFLPSMLGNPVFVAALLSILAYGHYLLERWLEKKISSRTSGQLHLGLQEDFAEQTGYPFRGIARFGGLDHHPGRSAVPQPERHHPMGDPPRLRFPPRPSFLPGQYR